MNKMKVFLGFIVICVLLLLSCRNPSESSYSEEIFEGIPSGMGSFSLRIAGQNERTIMPETIPDIVLYELAFTGSSTVTVDRTSENLSEPVLLATGNYHLLVTGYLDEGKTEPVAWGEKDNIAIDEGVGSSCTVPLQAFTPDGTEYGKYVWNIDYPADVSSVNMKITPLNGGTPEQTYWFVSASETLTTKSNIINIKSGYYNVLFTLEKPNAETLEWLEVLHIYQNMASVYNHVFEDAGFNNTNYLVTFNFNDGITSNGELSHIHGELINISSIPDPGRNGYVFSGWYTDNGSWDTVTDKWDFSTRRLSRSLTLNARWVPKPKLDLPATVNFSATYGYTSGVEGQTVTINNTWPGAAKVTDIRLSGAAAGSFTLSGVDLVLNSNIVSGGNASFTILPKGGLNAATYNAGIIITYEGVETTMDGIGFSDSGANTVSFVVNRKTISINSVAPPSKTYDRTTTAAAGLVTFSGFAGSETFTLGTDYTVSAVFANANAGSANKQYTYTVTMLSTAKANNYNLTPNTKTGTNGSIIKKDISINTVSALSKMYDKTASATAGTVTFTGIVSGDSLTSGTDYTVTAVFTHLDYNAGFPKPYSYTITLLGTTMANNYNLTSNTRTGMDGTINPATLTLSVTNPSRTTFTPLSGETTATITMSVSGIIAGDSSLLSYSTTSGFTINNTTLTYNGTTEFSNPAVSLVITVSAGSNYTTGTVTLNTTVYDGQEDYIEVAGRYDRRIPVTKANIRAFNIYANTINGLKRHYKLTQNIVASDLRNDLGVDNNWLAIGNSSPYFTGSFDGQRNTITGLTINTTSAYQGMFGYLNTPPTSSVKNIGLINVKINGGNFTGGIVGYNSGIVQVCYASGTVSGGNYTGGVVGYNHHTVLHCYAGGDVYGSSYTGGVTGYNIGGSVRNCYAMSNVSGGNYTGGVVGYIFSGTIQYCYATGNVSGTNNSGGIAGDNNETIQNCVALNNKVTITTTGVSAYVGRVLGEPNHSGPLNNYGRSNMTLTNGSGSVNITGLTGLNTVHGGNVTQATALTPAFWQTGTNWLGGDPWNSTIWNYPSGTTLPTLKNMPTGTQSPQIN